MKQMITSPKTLLLVLFLTAVSSFSFAGAANDLSPRLRTSFQHDFKNAHLIGTEIHENFIKVTFTKDNNILFAYYATNGKLLGVVHNMLSNELPLELQMSLKQNYGDYWITELFQINGDDESGYFVSLQNGDEILNLRSTPDQGWEVYSSTRKN
jgi:hypothetical protein